MPDYDELIERVEGELLEINQHNRDASSYLAQEGIREHIHEAMEGLDLWTKPLFDVLKAYHTHRRKLEIFSPRGSTKYRTLTIKGSLEYGTWRSNVCTGRMDLGITHQPQNSGLEEYLASVKIIKRKNKLFPTYTLISRKFYRPEQQRALSGSKEILQEQLIQSYIRDLNGGLDEPRFYRAFELLSQVPNFTVLVAKNLRETLEKGNLQRSQFIEESRKIRIPDLDLSKIPRLE